MRFIVHPIPLIECKCGQDIQYRLPRMNWIMSWSRPKTVVFPVRTKVLSPYLFTYYSVLSKKALRYKSAVKVFANSFSKIPGSWFALFTHSRFPPHKTIAWHAQCFLVERGWGIDPLLNIFNILHAIKLQSGRMALPGPVIIMEPEKNMKQIDRILNQDC